MIPEPGTGRSGRGKKWSQSPLTQEQRALAAKWVEMGCGHARQWAKVHPRLRADFISAATWAVCEAARNYDPSQNASFFTYLRWHLRCARKEVLRAAVPKGFRITGSLRNNPVALARRRPLMLAFDAGNDDRPGETCPDAESRDQAEIAEQVQALLDHLAPDAQDMVRGHGEGRPLPEMPPGSYRKRAGRTLRAHLARLRELAEGAAPTPDELRRRLGAALRRERQARGWGTREMGRRAGLSHSKITKIETAFQFTTPHTVRAVAEALGQHPGRWLALAGHPVGGVGSPLT